jgi:hypothetical protein
VAAGVGLCLGFLIGRLGCALAASCWLCGCFCVSGGLLFGGCNAFSSSFFTLACFDFGADEGIISCSGRWNKGFLGVLTWGCGDSSWRLVPVRGFGRRFIVEWDDCWCGRLVGGGCRRDWVGSVLSWADCCVVVSKVMWDRSRGRWRMCCGRRYIFLQHPQNWRVWWCRDSVLRHPQKWCRWLPGECDILKQFSEVT